MLKITKRFYIVADSIWLLGNIMLKFPNSKGWLLHRVSYPKLPCSTSLLVWQTTAKPMWLDFLIARQSEISEISIIERNPRRHEIVAGYAFSSCGNGMRVRDELDTGYAYK